MCVTHDVCVISSIPCVCHLIHSMCVCHMICLSSHRFHVCVTLYVFYLIYLWFRTPLLLCRLRTPTLLCITMSDSASEASLALSKLKTLDESVAIPYSAPVEGVVSLRVITCEICRHKSNEPNPLVIKIVGYDGRCWPFQGTDVKKRAPRMESPHALKH